jgi:hypothetical protein
VPAAPSAGQEGFQLLLVFGSRHLLVPGPAFDALAAAYPGAHVVGCSTAGEICGTQVLDDSLVCTALRFEHSRVECSSIEVGGEVGGFDAGARLARDMPKDGLVHLFVLSDGTRINGSELVRGLISELPPQVTVTGGLAGDGDRFEETIVVSGGRPLRGAVAAVGFFGERFRVGYGSLGGWDPFGPERLITRSRGNVLFELDGRSALQLYKKYLGEHADGLPATGLRFPLSIRTLEGAHSTGVVRTILAVDESEQSLTFAGDVPEGAYARFMKSNVDRLIDGATGAARTSAGALDAIQPELGVLISCVGRRMVLTQRVEEEVEAVQDVVGPRTVLTGFYSYGEISPFAPSATCELHNQTMTITTFAEV